jgi:hypothetical protein
MNELIEKNRRLLRFCCDALRSIGQIVLLLGVLSVCGITTLVLLSKFGNWHAPKSFEMIIAKMPLAAFNIFFIGIGILGLAQFIKYLFERNYKPGWILRHGDMFFYLYALLTILEAVWIYMTNYHSPSSDIRVDMGFVTVFSIVVKVMALVGLGRILRHLMPVIEESKSLV